MKHGRTRLLGRSNVRFLPNAQDLDEQGKNASRRLRVDLTGVLRTGSSMESDRSQHQAPPPIHRRPARRHGTGIIERLSTARIQQHRSITRRMSIISLLRRALAAYPAPCWPRFHPHRRPGACLVVGFATGRRRRMEQRCSAVPEYNYIENAEDLFAYQSGGYHPVTIGDYIHNERYRIVHKLGHGAYSTVWLARHRDSDQLVAIKIDLASSTSNQLATLLALQEAHSQRVTNVPTVLDHFDISGPNGVHSCCVMSPAMCSLNDAKDAGIERLFPVDVARALTLQLLQAVAFVHHHGFVHGDIHPGNVLLKFPTSFSFSSLSDQQLYAQYGKPVLENVTRSDGDASPLPPNVPPQVVMPL